MSMAKLGERIISHTQWDNASTEHLCLKAFHSVETSTLMPPGIPNNRSLCPNHEQCYPVLFGVVQRLFRCVFTSLILLKRVVLLLLSDYV